MKNTLSLSFLVLILGCHESFNGTIDNRTHCTAEHDSSGSDSSSGSSDDSSSSESTTGSSWDPNTIPEPTAPCPTIVDGVVQICPEGIPCRTMRVVNAANATGTGPLSLHWHGTFETPESILANDWAAQQIQSMVIQEGGLMILPHADSDAVNRLNNPFPWWISCGDLNPSQCDREDDFILANEIVACAVEQELVSPDRLNVSGMSAGGIMTTYLLDRVGYFASAVVWSGGKVESDLNPITPPSNRTFVMILHGNNNDVYCGAGVSDCHLFRPEAEELAADLIAAGTDILLCDHDAGHATAMGPEGALIMRIAGPDPHPAADYPVGHVENGVWVPGTGPVWMLNNYCYNSGAASPWD